MEFIQINLTIPDTIKSLFSEFQLIDSNSCIAGGFLCDLYLKKDFKDVDIFCSIEKQTALLQFLKDKGIKTEPIKGQYDFSIQNENEMYEFYFNNICFQIIFTKLGKDIVNFFDIRMREFYHSDNETFASKEALDDLKKKEIHTGVIFNPTKTLERILRFEKKYSFYTPDLSFKRLNDSFETNRPFIPELNEFEKSLSDNEIKEKFKDFFWSNLNEDGHFNFEKTNPSAFYLLKSYNFLIKRSVFDEIYVKPVIPDKKFNINAKQSIILDKIIELENEIHSIFNKNIVKMLFEYPNLVHEWKENLSNKTYLYTIFKNKMVQISENNENDEHFSHKFALIFKQIKFFSNMELKNNYKVSVSFKIAKFSKISIEDYLNDNIVRFSFDNKYIQYNLEKKEIDSRNIGFFHAEILIELFLDKINIKKIVNDKTYITQS